MTTNSERTVSNLGVTCKYPEWKRDDELYPDWDHSDECFNNATSALLYPDGTVWSFRCDEHRTAMEQSIDVEDVVASDTI